MTQTIHQPLLALLEVSGRLMQAAGPRTLPEMKMPSAMSSLGI